MDSFCSRAAKAWVTERTVHDSGGLVWLVGCVFCGEQAVIDREALVGLRGRFAAFSGGRGVVLQRGLFGGPVEERGCQSSEKVRSP